MEYQESKDNNSIIWKVRPSASKWCHYYPLTPDIQIKYRRSDSTYFCAVLKFLFFEKYFRSYEPFLFLNMVERSTKADTSFQYLRLVVCNWAQYNNKLVAVKELIGLDPKRRRELVQEYEVQTTDKVANNVLGKYNYFYLLQKFEFSKLNSIFAKSYHQLKRKTPLNSSHLHEFYSFSCRVRSWKVWVITKMLSALLDAVCKLNPQRLFSSTFYRFIMRLWISVDSRNENWYFAAFYYVNIYDVYREKMVLTKTYEYLVD